MFGDDSDDLPQAPAWRRYGVPALVLLGVSGAAYGIVSLLKSTAPGPRPHIEQHITSIILPPPLPPPPPPPLPKVVEKPREEQKVVTHIPKSPPKMPSPPAPLTAVAGVGNDAYGLKAGDGSGGDFVGDGGTGDGGDAGAYYETVVKSMVSDAVGRDDRLRTARYRATVSFVFDAAGRVQNVSFQTFDGDSEVREEVVRALSRMAASENIPANMAKGKPWVVRLSAHAPG